MPTIKLTPTKKDDDLYLKYDGQYGRQNCYLCLGIDTGELSARVNYEIGSCTTQRAYTGVDVEWSIPPLKVKPLTELMESIKQECQSILDNTFIDWRNGNWLGRPNDKARDLYYEIEHTISELESTWDYYDVFEVWEAADYYESVDVIKEYNLKLDTSDEYLEKVADELLSDVVAEDNHIDRDDLIGFIKDQIQSKIDEQEDDDDTIEDTIEETTLENIDIDSGVSSW